MKKFFTLVVALFVMTFCAKAQVVFSDDFEGYASFTVDPAGSWTFYDVDGAPTYTSQGLEWPNAGYVGSGIVMNPSQITSCTWAPHSGNQFFAVFDAIPYYIEEGTTTNDWMVTPELTLTDAAIVSFYARESTSMYGPEIVRVLYSTTTNEMAAFTELNTINVSTEEWEEYTFNIPSNTKYVAVNVVSDDVYAFFMDDFTISLVPTEPMIQAIASIDFGTIETNTQAIRQTTVIGYNLTSDITAITDAPFAVSTDGTTWNTTASLSAAGGTLYVQYVPTAEGFDNGTVELVSGSASATIDLVGAAFECDAIVDFPFIENFSPESESLKCWQIVDANNDDNTLEVREVQAGIYGETYMYSSSMAANDWLISPELVLGSGMMVSFDYRTASFQEKYSVYVIEEGQTYETATNILPVQSVTSSSSWATRTIDLSAYENQTVRVAIKVESDADQYWIAFTNFMVYDLTPHLITVLSADETMGSVTGNGTFFSGELDTLTATAYSGYRFTGWDDGNTENPRIITVTNDASYTANFADLGDDELQYDNGIYVSAMGAGGTLTWGVRFESSELVGYDNLSSVRIFDVYDGTYEVRIYQGGITAPETQVYTESITLMGSQDWFEAELATPVILDTTQSLWVVLNNSGVTYPAAASDFVGNPDGSWVSLNGITWAPIYNYGNYYYTWMIHAVLGQNTTTYTITATSADETMGTVTGGGTYEEGATATLTATANDGYHFVQWNDGNTDNPRTIIVTEDAAFVATFAQNVVPTYTITVTSSDETMGTVTGGGTYEEGATATLTATANDGYHFVQWNDGNTDNPRTITVTEDATYTATFEADPTPTYTITVTSADVTMGTVTGGGVYNEGDTVMIEAIPNANYEFVQWNDDNTDNPRRIIVTQDQEFVATFQPVTAISAVDMNNISVYSHNNQIVVNNAEGYAIAIYNMAGQLIVSEASNAQATKCFTMNTTGIYLVRVGQDMFKKVIITK